MKFLFLVPLIVVTQAIAADTTPPSRLVGRTAPEARLQKHPVKEEATTCSHHLVADEYAPDWAQSCKAIGAKVRAAIDEEAASLDKERAIVNGVAKK
jgi:hypothetical protein